MTVKEIKEFLTTIAEQRRRLWQFGISSKPVPDLDIRKVETASTLPNPTLWMVENEAVVFNVCPKQYRKKMNLIYQTIKKQKHEIN